MPVTSLPPCAEVPAKRPRRADGLPRPGVGRPDLLSLRQGRTAQRSSPGPVRSDRYRSRRAAADLPAHAQHLRLCAPVGQSLTADQSRRPVLASSERGESPARSALRRSDHPWTIGDGRLRIGCARRPGVAPERPVRHCDATGRAARCLCGQLCPWQAAGYLSADAHCAPSQACRLPAEGRSTGQHYLWLGPGWRQQLVDLRWWRERCLLGRDVRRWPSRALPICVGPPGREDSSWPPQPRPWTWVAPRIPGCGRGHRGSDPPTHPAGYAAQCSADQREPSDDRVPASNERLTHRSLGGDVHATPEYWWTTSDGRVGHPPSVKSHEPVCWHSRRQPPNVIAAPQSDRVRHLHVVDPIAARQMLPSAPVNYRARALYPGQTQAESERPCLPPSALPCRLQTNVALARAAIQLLAGRNARRGHSRSGEACALLRTSAEPGRPPFLLAR